MIDQPYDQQLHLGRVIGHRLRLGEGTLSASTLDALRDGRQRALQAHRNAAPAPGGWAIAIEQRWLLAGARALAFLVFFALVAQSGAMMNEAFGDGYEHDASILADDLPLNAYLDSSLVESN